MEIYVKIYTQSVWDWEICMYLELFWGKGEPWGMPPARCGNQSDNNETTWYLVQFLFQGPVCPESPLLTQCNPFMECLLVPQGSGLWNVCDAKEPRELLLSISMVNNGKTCGVSATCSPHPSYQTRMLPCIKCNSRTWLRMCLTHCLGMRSPNSAFFQFKHRNVC